VVVLTEEKLRRLDSFEQFEFLKSTGPKATGRDENSYVLVAYHYCDGRAWLKSLIFLPLSTEEFTKRLLRKDNHFVAVGFECASHVIRWPDHNIPSGALPSLGRRRRAWTEITLPCVFED
jgi:hypothetical protein